MPDSCGKTATSNDIEKWNFKVIALSLLIKELVKEKEKEKEKRGRTPQTEREDAYSAEKLAKNLIAAGYERPPGTAAHHIVAGNDSRAAGTREIFKSFGIGINADSNGVFLPHKERNDKLGTYHRSVHTDKYYSEVNQRLEEARTREEAIEILERIGQQLANNTFPYR